MCEVVVPCSKQGVVPAHLSSTNYVGLTTCSSACDHLTSIEFNYQSNGSQRDITHHINRTRARLTPKDDDDAHGKEVACFSLMAHTKRTRRSMFT